MRTRNKISQALLTSCLLLLVAAYLGCSGTEVERPDAPKHEPSDAATDDPPPIDDAAVDETATDKTAADDAEPTTQPLQQPEEANMPDNKSTQLTAAQRVADVPLIPREILFGNPEKASPELSDDGAQLAFLAPLDGVLNVWVGPVDDVAAAKPVTHDKGRGIRSYFWAHTNQHIIYVQDTEGDENWKVFIVDLDSGQTRELTPGAAEAEVAAENTADNNAEQPSEPQQAAPITARISGVSHRFPEEILISVNRRNPQFHDVFKVDILSGEAELVQENPGYSGFMFDEDYNLRFGVKYAPDGGQLYDQPAEEGEWETFLKIPSDDTMTTSLAGFNKEGNQLYLIDSTGRDTGALYKVDLATGDKEFIVADDRTDIGAILAHPTENTLQAVTFHYDRKRWKFFDEEVEKDVKLLQTKHEGDVGIGSRTLDDRRWIVAYLKDNGPVNYYLFDRDSKDLKFLFTNRSELEGLPLVHMHPEIIKSRDGLNLVSYLSLPKGSEGATPARPKAPLPLILDVHGGPWVRDHWGYNPVHQLLANRGYAVLSVNYRGSTGFGKAFGNAGNREWSGKMHDDLIDAVNWAVEEGIADKDKVCIMGGSYGGYATLVGLTFTPEVFACGVDIVGPSSLVTLLETIPPYWAPALQMFKTRVGDHTTEEGRAELLKRSPLTYVDKIQRPLIIAQGANDPRVKQSEADQIVEAMQEKNIPVTYVLFPDEGHGFARPENRLAFNAVTELFLKRHLGGRAEVIGEAFEGSTITVPAGADQVEELPEALKA
ncbi:MAG: S9 family peptidase, partial [Pirellulales bacterium]